ncbi:MAG: NAD(P)/FAD-dependent oxidoreductase [Pseudobacteriovorax sp.]|nr:NAD(P)/FAD-dependent oxidoreductase [Pseudobacteriovorax sp.]
MESRRLAVIGGGAAGFFTAINSKELNRNLEVTIFEATPRVLTKVKVSGGGRCNVTHNCFDPSKLVTNYPRGSKELRGPFSLFQPKDTIEWFRKRGIGIKAEDDGRMFPESNKSQTIIDCFLNECSRLGLKVLTKQLIEGVEWVESEKAFRVDKKGTDQAPDFFDCVMLATGSAPFGYQLAKQLGHPIIEPNPSLFTFEIDDDLFTEQPGTSFKQAELKLSVGKKKYTQKAPLLFTHWGLSGPAVLKLSAFAARDLFDADYQARLTINYILKSEEQAYNELLDWKQANERTKMSGAPPFGLQKRFWSSIMTRSNISDQIWAGLSNKSIRRISESLTRYQCQVCGKGTFKEEFVSCGGVGLKSVNFKTMESKIRSGLFFAGEVLDIDGITGGFNFQNAWTTAWIASHSIAQFR